MNLTKRWDWRGRWGCFPPLPPPPHTPHTPTLPLPQIDYIGGAVDQLNDKALHMKDQVEITTGMIAGMSDQVDSAQEKLLNVNEKLKGTLDEVTKGENCCMDILCILLLLGLIAVAIQVFRS